MNPTWNNSKSKGTKRYHLRSIDLTTTKITKSGSILSIKFKPVASNVLYDDCVRFTC